MFRSGMIQPQRLLARGYASRSRNTRPPGAGRQRPDWRYNRTRGQHIEDSETPSSSQESDSQLWNTSSERINPDSNPTEGLRTLLMAHRALHIERQVEMLNVFLGFEQCNRYSISNELGDIVGHIVEEDGGLLAGIRRQALATHRPFSALIMDTTGTPLLWLRRPFSWINSKMYVQRSKHDQFTDTGEPVLESFGEVQQVWHIIRRKYELYLKDPSSQKRILSVLSSTPDTEADSNDSEPRFIQLAKVDEPFLSWTFRIQDEKDHPFAVISRGFRGLARELFTDTGKYTVMFDSQLHEEVELNTSTHASVVLPPRALSLEERALILALAVNVDFDYFSRHSHTGPGMLHLGAFD